MTEYEVVGVVPARLDSKRFPRKMLVEINGKTLIQRTYENALRANSLDALLIATDSQEIFDHASAFGAPVVMTSSDCANGTERAAQALQRSSQFSSAKIVVNIQGDEPDLAPAVIDRVVLALKEDQEAQVSTACVRIKSDRELRDSSVVKCVINRSGQALYFSRAMIPCGKSAEFNVTTCYYKHLGLYCFRKNFLLKFCLLPNTPLQVAEDLEQLKILEHGYLIHVVEAESDSIGIDTPEDLSNYLKSRPYL